jgi:hypothetical protein
MPVLRIPFTPADGLRVQVQITLGRPEILRRRQAGLPIPQPHTATALIDTGAERTCIDPSIVPRLSLPVVNPGFVSAPGAGTGPAIFGGATFGFTYEAGLVILHPVTKPPSSLVIHELEVETLSLAQFGIEAVIGRDVLASCVLLYDGPAGSATLAY